METNNNTAVAKVELSENNQKLLTGLLTTLDKERQLSWLQLGNLKAITKKNLEAKFLECQVLLIKYDSLAIDKLQEAIDGYKKAIKDIPEQRKGFTSYLDKISKELMAIEKDAEEWDTYKKATARFLQLREEKEKKELTDGAKTREASDFRTHIANQFIRLKTEYEIALNNKIVEEYSKALDKEYTEDGLKDLVITLENTLCNLKIGDAIRFSATKPTGYVLLNTVEELVKESESVEKPDYAAIRDKKIRDMKDKFNLYFSDKANSAKAKEVLEENKKREEAKLTANAETTQNVNTLISKGSSSLSFDNVRGIKRKRVIVVKDTDTAWAHKVISEFLARFDSCRPRLKVKAWSNLKLEQMVNALNEEEKEISGFEYEEITK